jgi:HK97 gp10 family phage protein
MSDFQIKIEGGPRIIQALSNLDKKVASQISRTVLRQAQKVILAEAKARCPEDTGFLKSQLKVRAIPRKKDTIGARVMVGEGFFKGESFYGGFVHFGHKIGKRGLPDRKKTDPQPWMQEAFDAKADQLAKQLPDMFWREIERATK